MEGQFFGGPMDGKRIPKNIKGLDWVSYDIDHGGHVVTYVYLYVEEYHMFEYAGEQLQEEEGNG